MASLQSLNNVCSISHLHTLGNIISSQDLVTEIILKWRSSGKHLFFVLSPNSGHVAFLERVAKGYPSICKKLDTIDTGHGGNTTLWFLKHPSFRGNTSPKWWKDDWDDVTKRFLKYIA